MKMNKPDFNVHPITHKELSLLSNHGEAIEHPPQTASRLISVLATSIKLSGTCRNPLSVYLIAGTIA